MASWVNNWFFYLHINFEILPNDLNGIRFVWVLVLRFHPIFIKWNNLIVFLKHDFFKHRIVLRYFVCQRLCFWWNDSSDNLGLSIITRLHWREIETSTTKMLMIWCIFYFLSLVVCWYLFIRKMKSFIL